MNIDFPLNFPGGSGPEGHPMLHLRLHAADGRAGGLSGPGEKVWQRRERDSRRAGVPHGSTGWKYSGRRTCGRCVQDLRGIPSDLSSFCTCLQTGAGGIICMY